MAMAMGRRRGKQAALFVPHQQLRSGGHAFYAALDRVLRTAGFDAFVEAQCARFYAARMGRPSVAPGVYFRCLLVGYFEGLDSERGIAWRVADSLSLREFLGLTLDTAPPDHSTLSRTRRLLDLETHRAVFTWILGVLATAGLVKGTTVGIDATTLEANAALRSLVRRADGQSYEAFLTGLAQASGIATPTRADLARLDRRRPKKGSNAEWVNPHEPDAQITKMKDGQTHLAHKQEQAVDLETGAVLAVTLAGGTAHDTQTLGSTLAAANTTLQAVRAQVDVSTATGVAAQVANAVADKGYHSNAVMLALATAGVRSYIAEPERGRRCWDRKPAERDAVYRNRRRIRGAHGKALLRSRGELLERPFAHALETGGMRRTHLRRHENILKRLLIHLGGLNLGLLMRTRFGIGTPRGLQGRADGLAAFLPTLWRLWDAVVAMWVRSSRPRPTLDAFPPPQTGWPAIATSGEARLAVAVFTTGC
jgi:transposase